MKIGDEDDSIELGGKELDNVNFRFTGDTIAAQRYIGEARKVLGELKQGIQLGEMQSGLRRVQIAPGVIVFASSYNGTVKTDIVNINVTPKPQPKRVTRFQELPEFSHEFEVPVVEFEAIDEYEVKRKVWEEEEIEEKEKKKLQDICTGFIVRISTENFNLLILHVIEPKREPEVNTDINSVFTSDSEDITMEIWWDGTGWASSPIVGEPIGELYGFAQSYSTQYDDLSDAPDSDTYKIFTDNSYNPNIDQSFPGYLKFTAESSVNLEYTVIGDFATWKAGMDRYNPGMYERNVEALPDVIENAYRYNEYYYGLSPVFSFQLPEVPCTRYFCGDYSINDNIIIIYPTIVSPHKNCAVVSPKKQKYKTTDEYMTATFISDTQTIELDSGINPINWGTLAVIMDNQMNVSNAIGNSYDKVYGTATSTYTAEFKINEWAMNSDVKAGIYEIGISAMEGTAYNDEYIDIVDGIEFEVDFFLFGSIYFQTYKYKDKIKNGKSEKIAKIDVLKLIEFDEEELYTFYDNPFIDVIDRPI